MALWSLVQSEETNKAIAVNKSMPLPDGSDYGPDVINDTAKPEEVVTLQARGMSIAEKNAEKAKARAMGATYTYTTVDSQTYTGVVISVKADRIDGTVYYVITIRLRRTDI